VERLQNNLFDVFKFRNLDNPDVYYDDNVTGLLQNYRAAFLRLAQAHLRNENNEQAQKVLDRMQTVIPEKVIPFPDYRLSVQLGQLYDMAGRKDELVKRLEAVQKLDPDNAMVTSYLVSVLTRDGKHAEVVTLLEKWLQKHPEDMEAKTRLEQERKAIAQPK